MAAVNLPTYSEFPITTSDPSVATKWEDWLEGFQAMLKAMKVTGEEDQRSMLLHYAGQDIRKLIKKLPDAGTETEYKKAVTALDKYFKPKMNNVYLMNLLHQTKQEPGESTDSFYICESKRKWT